jgi:ceramide glucosyltransferase
MTALLILTLFFLACSIAYNLLVLEAARRYRGQAMHDAGAELPPVSIFKPLRGAEPHLYDCLASFCRQDYPQYEVLCCAADPGDPAVAVVQRLQKDFPGVPVRMLFVDRSYGTNQKINSLDKMYREMRHQYLLISDDDVRVGTDYLRRVMAELADPQVGVLTCPYRGRPGGTLASLFEALGIAGEFFCGVFMARMLEGVNFAMGSTMGCRKDRLEAVGGFTAFADYLADDFELGARIAEQGHPGRLSSYVVDNLLPADSWGSMIRHQFRWIRSQASSRPKGHLGLILTYGSVFALLAAVLAPASPLVWAMTGGWLAARMASGWTVGAGTLGDPTARRYFWLLPVRELLTAGIWGASLIFKTVYWKGQPYRLEGGKMVRI